MKNALILVAASIVAVVSALLIKLSNSPHSLIKENIEALSDWEITVGPLCAYDPDYLCLIYFDYDDSWDLIDDATLV